MKYLIPFQCFILVYFFSFQLAHSQKYAHQFGMVGNEELEMKYYAPDREAEAVVIYSFGDSRFIENVYGVMEIHFVERTRIKIFNKSGYRFGEIEIPYYKESNVEVKKAASFNLEEGKMKRTDFDPKAVFTEKINDEWDNKKFAIPNIKDGTVIEYEYELVTENKFNLPGWNFQLTIPVIHSEYDLRMVPNYTYQYILQGTNKFSSMEKSKDEYNPRNFGGRTYFEDIYKFIMVNQPAFRDESFITNIRDYQVRMDFQLSGVHGSDGSSRNLVSTWPSLNDEMLKDPYFGRYINASEKEAEKFLSKYDLSGLNEVEKIEKISDLVKMNFKWNGENRKFTTKNPKDFMNQKNGNSAEINLFLLACLNTQNILAYPVLIGTRNYGKIKVNYPFLHFFNYVLVMAKTNDQTFLLDATEPLLPFDKIPVNCLNESGLVVEKKTENWVNLSMKDQGSSISENISVTINPEKKVLDCTFRIVSDGYDALELKQRNGNKYETIREDLASRGLNPQDSIRIINFTDRKQDYILEFTGLPDMESIENKIVISPFLQEVMQENVLKSPSRTYPVDFIYKYKRQYETTINIPERYKVSFHPPDYNIDNSMLRVVYQTKIENNIVSVRGMYEFKKSVYEPKDYLNLKAFISEIVRRFNEKIVLDTIE